MKARDSLSELELNISRLMELKPADSACAELRDHVLDFYQRITIGQLRQVIKGEEQIKKLEQDWQATCDALIDEQKKSKAYIANLEDKVESLQMDLAKLKSEHY